MWSRLDCARRGSVQGRYRLQPRRRVLATGRAHLNLGACAFVYCTSPMRRFVQVLVPITVLAVSPGCIGASAQSGTGKTIDRTATLGPGGTLALEVNRGSARVTARDQPTVEIHARIEAPAGVTDDYAERAVAGTTIQVTEASGSVRIRADYSGVPYIWLVGRSLPRVSYEITVPRKVNVDLDADRSDVAVEGLDGRASLDLDRSSLHADNLAGELALRVDRGPRVEVNGLRGSLNLNLDRTEATLRAVNLAKDSRVELDRGRVDVEWSDGQALTVDGSLDRSSVSSDLPITIDRRGRSFHATLNGGGPVLRVTADRSEVHFRAK
jgi:hypothetical protein